MIRLALHGFSQAILSFRTLLFGTMLLAYGLYQITQIGAITPVTPWAVIISIAADTYTTSLFGIIWWILWIFPTMRNLQAEHVQLRYGSRRNIIFRKLAMFIGIYTAWIIVQLVIYAALTLHLGVTLSWDLPPRFSQESVSAFSADAFATYFSSPLLALVCIFLFTGLTYLAIAAIAVAGTSAQKYRATLITLSLLLLWAACCGFARFPLPTYLDFSAIFTLGWALYIPGGLTLWAVWIVIAACATWALIRIDVLRNARTLLRSTWSWIAGMAACTLVAALYTKSSAERADAAAFFAGADRDIIGYVLVAAIPLLFATGTAAPLAEIRAGMLSYQAFRRGSYRAWMLRFFLQQGVRALFSTALIVGILTVTFGTEASWGGSSATVMLAGAAGMFAQMLLLAAVAGLFVWVPLPLEQSWFGVFAAVLALGYLFPASAAAGNFAAAYAVRLEAPLSITFISALITTMLAVAVAGFTWLRATPSRAEVFA